ncbi:three-Cys-motif partner protein TcmP [Treponema primitia]|uniref:three-Cys-motif partner protein TcmP n=1 Tax=Treponema primitia TaxID=88058 RepID=UPI0039807545
MKTTWGGDWTEQKLDAFEKYVNVYLTIMNKHRDKYNWKLIYFDAFAGSGSRAADTENADNFPLFEELGISKDEIAVYKGAAERVVCITQRGFDYYYFIEKDEISRKELEERLNTIEHENKLKMIFRDHDANEQIHTMARAMKKDKNLYALTLLDPFGMQVDWSAIESLAGTNTDLWILIPSGVIINRLLDREGKLTHINKLISFFGMSEEEIRNEFYREENKSIPSLFEIDALKRKTEEPITKITELYIKRLKMLFPQVTEKPLEMKNTRNVSIYHFAFASNNPTAKKIASDIIGRISK